MWIENLNILSAWWFMFFLLILVIGYFIVEILLWEKYFLRKILARNQNHVLDRVIHYIIWWVIWNFLFFLCLHFTDWHNTFVELFDNSDAIAKEFNVLFWVNPLSYKIVNFSIFYLWFFILVTSTFRFVVPLLGDLIIKCADGILRQIEENKTSRSKKKKSKKESS